MHTADDRVGLEHEITPRGRHQDGGVVNEAEGTRVLCERTKIARDQAVFGGFSAHRCRIPYPAAR
jgi:hypothetical protein